MAWDKGFNFRQTAGWVTDGADETYVLGSDTYPVTRGGRTFGLTLGGVDNIDRGDGTQDRRVGGVHYTGDNTATFRVDLPNTGPFNVRLAVGDYGFGQTNNHIKIFDNVTEVINVGPVTTIADQYYDASGVARTTIATWAASNVAVNVNFASTTLFLKYPVSGTYSVIAHMFISEGSSALRFILGTH